MAHIQAKHESRIVDLLEIIKDKTEETSDLKSTVKEVKKSSAEERIELREKHWEDKLKLWNKKKVLRTTVATKV